MAFSHRTLPRLAPVVPRLSCFSCRRRVTTAAQSRKEGDISSVFVSLSGGPAPVLPSRFSDVKRQLIQGREDKLIASWERLLAALQRETKVVGERGSAIIPSVHYHELPAQLETLQKELKERGVAIIRGVVPKDEARAYKEDVERYVRENPSTKGNVIKSRSRQIKQRPTPSLQRSLLMIRKYSSSTGHPPRSGLARTQI